MKWSRISVFLACGAFTLGCVAVAGNVYADNAKPPKSAVASHAPSQYATWSGVWVAQPSDYWGFPTPPAAAKSFDDGAACLPMGMPAMMMILYQMETLALPDQLTIASEDQNILRRVYLDGRGHPKDFWPTYAGHSIGHWEGNVLVVDTVGIRADTRFHGRVHTDALHIVEHMRLIDPNTFEDVLVADDAKAVDKSWTTTKRYTRQPKGTEINEFVCEEDNRNPPKADGQPSYVGH